MPNASKTFEFEGCIFECTLSANFHVEHHPWGMGTAAETIMDMDDVNWTWDGAPISQEDLEALIGDEVDIEQWIDQTAAEIDQYANDREDYKADEDLDR